MCAFVRLPPPSVQTPQTPPHTPRTQEAKQRVPHFLLALDDPLEQMEELAVASGVKG